MGTSAISVNVGQLWADFRGSPEFDARPDLQATHDAKSAFRRYDADGDPKSNTTDDTITLLQGGGVRSGGGDDVINVKAIVGFGQNHTYAGADDDVLNMSFGSIGENAVYTYLSHGHHVRGDRDGADARGTDTFNFQSVSNIKDGAVVVGRIDDFDSTRDTITVDGGSVNLGNLPATVGGHATSIVEYNGNFDDPNAAPQQWLLVDNGDGFLFYTLEGARVIMDANFQGGINNSQQEEHFLTSLKDPNGGLVNLQQIGDIEDFFDDLTVVDFVDPQNVVPVDFTLSGYNIINDTDGNRADVTAPVDFTSGNDAIAAGLNNDIVDAGNGNDYVWGGTGNDIINGGAGNDVIDGGYAGGFHEDLSVGGVNAQIFRLYEGMLGNSNPDQAGFDFWTGHLKSGNITLEQAINGFIGPSGKFDETANSDFIKGLYYNILDRTADPAVTDPAGYNFWLNLLDNNSISREEAIKGFLESGEFKTESYDEFLAYMGQNARDVNDTLTGGSGDDTFVFGERFGNDEITDFNSTQSGEKIDLSGVSSITSFADLTQNHMVQVGQDTVIADAAGGLITLTNVDPLNLTAGDFIF